MNKEKVLLSISMLISGREEMKKSLESLICFKKALPCEIILVDTGCNTMQRDFAKQYADKIVDFVWCNDFATARNAGLKKARGEWFLYLDDDEWFEDPREIIAFFESGEYKYYNSATYIVRNYMDSKGTMYHDSYPSRMCRIEPETEFVGKIHEYLNTFGEPKKIFSTYAHHYGYANMDDGGKTKHKERNIPLLLEMIERYPDDPRWTAQLVQEYFADKQFNAVFQTSTKWLQDVSVDGDARYIGSIYAYTVLSLYIMGTFEESEQWLKKALDEPKLKQDFMEPTLAFFYMVGARVYSKLKKNTLCREYVKKYLDSYRKFKDDRLAVEKGTEAITAAVFQENMLYGTVLTVMGTLIRAEDQNLAEEVFYIPNWQDARLLNQLDMEWDIVDAACSVSYCFTWTKIIQTLVSRENGIYEMIDVFQKAENTYIKEGDEEKLNRLRRIVSELNYKHIYILCKQILWKEQTSRYCSTIECVKEVEMMFEELFKQFPQEILRVKGEVWRVAERRGFSIENMFAKVDFFVWKHCLDRWRTEASLEEMQEWNARIESWGILTNSRSEILRIKCLEGLLYRQGEERCDLAEIEETFRNYKEAVVDYYGPCYEEAVLDEIPETMREELQLTLRLNNVWVFRKQGDDFKMLEAVRKCLGIYPFLENTVGYYAGLLRNEVRQRNEEAEMTLSELNQVMESLKGVVKQKMVVGAYREAIDILHQICQCVPEDQETKMLLEEAENRLKKPL